LLSNAQGRMPWLNERSFGFNAGLVIFFRQGKSADWVRMI
jgi:hypothetical protein